MAMHLETTESKVLLVGEKDTWIPINRRISRILGKNAAEVIQLIHYWITTHSGALIKGRRWIYNTYDEWSKQLDIAKSTLRSVISSLEKMGILLSDNFNRKKSDRTKWYTIAYDVLKSVVGADQEDPPCSPPNQPVDNSSTWTAKNQHIIYGTKITSENTGLNSACARETFQPLVEECKQPVKPVSTIVKSTPEDLTTSAPKAHRGYGIEGFGSNPIRETEPSVESVELKPILQQTPEVTVVKTQTKTVSAIVEPETTIETQTLAAPSLAKNSPDSVATSSIADKAYEIVEELISSKLDKPLEINKTVFEKAIKRSLGKFFGIGELGLERWRDFCQKISNNDFLMGKKVMKSGDRFHLSIRSFFSEKIIQSSWDMSGFFRVYPPKKPTPGEIKCDDDNDWSEPEQTPTLSLEEVLTMAQDLVDRGVKQKLYQTLGAVTYQSWFHSTGFVAKGDAVGFTGGELDFEINTGFARDYVLTHYGQALRTAFSSVVIS